MPGIALHTPSLGRRHTRRPRRAGLPMALGELFIDADGHFARRARE